MYYKYKIGIVFGKISKLIFFPTLLLVLLCRSREYKIDNIVFIDFDVYVIFAVLASFSLTLASFSWWVFCGEGFLDFMKLLLGLLPLSLLLSALDPIGVGVV